jgi:hypothetical protein
MFILLSYYGSVYQSLSLGELWNQNCGSQAQCKSEKALEAGFGQQCRKLLQVIWLFILGWLGAVGVLPNSSVEHFGAVFRLTWMVEFSFNGWH